MDLAFLCGLFPEYLEQEIINASIGRIDFAANNLQWSLVRGIDFHNGKPIKLLNSVYIGSFPNGYKKLNVKTEKFAHTSNALDLNIGFCNLIGFKFISRFYTTFRSIFNWSKDGSGEKKVLIIYAMHSPFLLSVGLLKLLNPRIKLCLIVPDLPEFMSDKNGLLHRGFKYLDSKIINYAQKKMDSFVLLSDFMTEKIKINKRPWVRMEGIFDNSLVLSDSVVERSNERIIMYSGNLDKSQGVLDLLSAFSKIESRHYRLWFTGYGNGLQEIKEAAVKDLRIQCFEKLTKNQLLEKQRMATLLINPLQPVNPKVRYFFPSKTMEYLASGSVTLMYKLPSIPIEYNEYLYFFEDSTIDGMKDRIIEICEKPQKELDEFGGKARTFILEHKTPGPQCKKLYDMLLKL